MTRIVLDTNLFVSALLSPKGKPAFLLKLVLEGRLHLVLSRAILQEIKAVLQYPKVIKLLEKNNVSPGEIDHLLQKIQGVTILTPGELEVNHIKEDPSDNMFLVCAVEGRADFIISGDSHLTDLRAFQGVKIVNPDAFLKAISA
jgi:putative PIN family toxin of toxin-antitoxin system